MTNQYYAQRAKGGCNPHRIGTIAVGTILYIQDRYHRWVAPVCRNPWIVEAWLPREYSEIGRPNTFCRGGHLAVVRSLRNGERKIVGDCHLLAAVEAGLERN